MLWCIDHKEDGRADINEGAGEIADREVRKIQQSNYWLAVIATLSPLLGLLGTILGMIKAFDVVAVAGELGDVSMVAEGISQALVTTAAGLIIAVPALAAYHMFKIRGNQLAIQLEDQASKAIDLWFPKKG